MSQEVDSVRIEEQACLWLERRDGADWSQSGEAELQTWLGESTAHVVAFVRLEAAWQQAQRLKALAGNGIPSMNDWQSSPVFDEVAPVDDIPPSEAGSSTRWRRPLHAVATGVLVSAIVAITWHLWPVRPDYSTPVGGLASVPMTDGSNITLNTDSQISIAVTRTERHVDLQQGEAFFEVARDPIRPFVVSVGKLRVIAVGTAFSVQRDRNDVRVAITEGTVRIEDGAVAERNPGAAVLTLSAGSIARATDAGVLVQEKPILEIEGDLGWRTGYLIFEDVTLADAVREFNRYNDRKMFIEDDTVASIRLSGKFRSTQFEAFVRLLEAGFPVHAQDVDGGIVLMGSNRTSAPAAPE